MKRVIVIGAGIVGTSTAFALSRAGADVTVLDRAQPGQGTSGNSFAWVNANQKLPREYYELNLAGMKEHNRLDQELGGSAWLHRHGNLAWTGDPNRYDDLCQRMERLQSWGYNAQWITAADVNRDLEPNLVFSGPSMRVAWFPEEAWLDGPAYVRSVLDRAVEAGVRVQSGQEVTGISVENDELQVTLADGQQLVADAVVNAAGTAANKIASMVGRHLPLSPTRGLMVRLAIGENLLTRVVHSTDVNIRPDGDGYLLVHHDSVDPLIGDQSNVAPDDPNCRELVRRAKRILPGVSGSQISETRVGVRPFPSDGVSCVGGVSSIPGYYEAVTHSGVTLGPLIGRLVSEEIMENRVDPITEPFRADRF